MKMEKFIKAKVVIYSLIAILFIALQVYVNIRTNPAAVMAPIGHLIALSIITFFGLYMLFFKINHFIEDAYETKRKLFKIEMENIILQKRLEEIENRDNPKDRSDTIDW